MITYNHAPYIRQALDSVLMQKRDFPIEICLGEDQSTDGTREICQEYAARYPGLIRLFLRDRADPARKQYASPIMHNLVETLKACRGEYVAFLEGDDYWTDPDKLRLQAEFLGVHPGHSMCFHRIAVLNQDTGVLAPVDPGHHGDTVGIGAACVRGIHTSSALIRRAALSQPPWGRTHLLSADYSLFFMAARRGAIGYLDRQMSVYRHHGSGVYTSRSGAARFRAAKRMFRFLRPLAPVSEQILVDDALALYALDSVKQCARKGLLGETLLSAWRCCGAIPPRRFALWRRLAGLVGAAFVQWGLAVAEQNTPHSLASYRLAKERLAVVSLRLRRPFGRRREAHVSGGCH